MIDINTENMKRYELETHDSYVNCTDNDEIRLFYARYITWLEKQYNTYKIAIMAYHQYIKDTLITPEITFEMWLNSHIPN